MNYLLRMGELTESKERTRIKAHRGDIAYSEMLGENDEHLCQAKTKGRNGGNGRNEENKSMGLFQKPSIFDIQEMIQR